MEKVILCNISDAKEIEDESRMYWTYEVLQNLGIEDGILFETTDINDYRNAMYELGIDVILTTGGNVSIYKLSWFGEEESGGWLPAKEENLIAQWKSPKRIKKIDTDRSVYYEIHLNCWSILDSK